MAADRRIIARWENPDPGQVPLLAEAGIQAVVLAAPHEGFAAACRAAGIDVLTSADFEFADLKTPAAAGARPVVLTEGTWPGVAWMGETAGASSGPWVDANLHWVAWLRALYPGRPALLGYLPAVKPERIVPWDSLELALIEAWVMGGNYLLALEPRFRESLLGGGSSFAREAWRNMGRTAQFLREHAAVFARPMMPTLTVLVEQGEATPELANLMFRRSLSPVLAPASAPPPPDPRCRVLVAADIEAPAEAVRRRILAHAQSGATVVVNGAWWRVPGLKRLKEEPDRDTWALGRGRVVAYRETIADPGDFAYDMIDLVGQERRAARLWSAYAAIAVAAPGALYAVNYGRPAEMGVLARIGAAYSRATLLRPEASPVALKAVRRGDATEVEIPALRRLAVVVFE